MSAPMTRQELRSRFGGVVAFPVTPFKADLSLDLEGLRKNLAHLAKFPFCAVVACGGTGEMYSLTPDEHRQVVAAAVEAFGSKAPVLAGVGYNQALAVEMARQ